MTKFRMIADDLTGANANCSLMKKIGLSAATILDGEGDLPENFDALAITTNSRAFDPDRSYTSVRSALKRFIGEDVELYSKRVDSTLRGNLGPEINAFFDKLGHEYMAIAVPAYPATGRIVVNGKMFVNGNLLINSDAGKDTKTPVWTSNVSELFARNLDYSHDSIYIEDIEKGLDHLVDLILEKRREGIRLLIFDGIVDGHLDLIAKAVLKSKIKFFAVDPGPFTLEIANQKLNLENKLNKVLMVVGSVTQTSIDQIRELLITYEDIEVVKVDARNLASKGQRDQEISRAITRAMKLLDRRDIILVTTTPYDDGEKRLDLKALASEEGQHIDELSLMISEGLAEIAKNIILSDFSFAGSFMSGGDITVAFADYMESKGLEIREEVIPLAAYGRLLGGLRPQLRLISKGGMVGDRDAMSICLEKLMQVSAD